MTPTATWSYPTEIRFGAGRIAELAQACKAAGITRPFLVTDPGIAGSPVFQTVMEALDSGGLAPGLFTETKANPDEETLAEALALWNEGAFDGVIALGGGSAMDLGKLVAFMAGQARPVWDFEDVGDWWTRADAGAIRPVVAVPTTAGTGSEVGRAGVLTDTARGLKKIIFHPKMLPGVVIADPALTASMPERITVGTGMDALAHCIEAYSSPHYHPMSQGIALEGMALVFDALPRVVAEPGDLEARGRMMSAAMMGAVAFQKGLGAVHAVSHPVGAMFDTHHGMTNGAVLPMVLEMNRPVIETRIAAAARYIGLGDGFDDFLNAVMVLRCDLNVPKGLAEMGVPEAALEKVVDGALVDPSAGGNPVEMTRENTTTLVRACFEGRA